ncbi:hypothetical protein GCM10018954_049600 [Kutzneria kofuensis]
MVDDHLARRVIVDRQFDRRVVQRTAAVLDRGGAGEQAEQPVARRQVGPVQEVLAGYAAGADLAQVLRNQVVLATEKLVQGALRHAGLVHQLADAGRLDAVAVEQARRRPHDAGARRFHLHSGHGTARYP